MRRTNIWVYRNNNKNTCFEVPYEIFNIGALRLWMQKRRVAGTEELFGYHLVQKDLQECSIQTIESNFIQMRNTIALPRNSDGSLWIHIENFQEVKKSKKGVGKKERKKKKKPCLPCTLPLFNDECSEKQRPPPPLTRRSPQIKAEPPVVGNLDRSIDFYTKVLGMKLLRKSENTEYKYTLAFVGYTDESSGAVIELTYNWGVESYDLGSAFGHIAIGVDNVASTCDSVRNAGGKVTREAGPVKGGKTIIGFVEDPDGYKIELIQDDQASQGLGH
ncbi:hypothetical protein CYY_008003 [Polysphondylium violaceum]|uniref:Glyoxalase I n=1 Tax=Polysphondylium violaceum TaxID=133409 RepID=A0A8J4PMI9_9MYCE|nr:hypothetical protein CYY_008003 [Polysphondylium violaceum]